MMNNNLITIIALLFFFVLSSKYQSFSQGNSSGNASPVGQVNSGNMGQVIRIQQESTVELPGGTEIVTERDANTNELVGYVTPGSGNQTDGIVVVGRFAGRDVSGRIICKRCFTCICVAEGPHGDDDIVVIVY